MKKILSAVIILATTSLQAETFTVNIPALQEEAKGVIKQLAATLGSELKQAKKEGGASAAISVCNTKAMPLTQLVNTESDWQIGRTSHKLRNLDNAPDQWEKVVLEQFQSKARQGANLDTLVFSQVIVDEEGRKVFRMMKAIPVAEQCLACHGSHVKSDLKAHILQLYPDDNATGFNVGDLRGAFTLKKYL